MGASALEMPPLHAIADSTAITRQRRYFLTLRVELAAMVGAATIATLSGVTDWKRLVPNLFPAVVLVLLITSLFVRLVRTARRFEEGWFESRALAESVKVEAWRYATQTPPYGSSNARGKFSDRVAELIQASRDVFGQLTTTSESGLSQITESMENLRSAEFDQRRLTYLKQRVANQVEWYERRSADHRRSANRWVTIGFAAEALAVLVVVLAMATPIPLDLLGLFTTIAAAGVAWLQSKDFRRLAVTYAVVQHDLMRIVDKFGNPQNAQALARLVDEVERTLSREHTFWHSRRSSA